jgi:hypothetical protein
LRKYAIFFARIAESLQWRKGGLGGCADRG